LRLSKKRQLKKSLFGKKMQRKRILKNGTAMKKKKKTKKKKKMLKSRLRLQMRSIRMRKKEGKRKGHPHLNQVLLKNSTSIGNPHWQPFKESTESRMTKISLQTGNRTDLL
jgi:hypothetical protein